MNIPKSYPNVEKLLTKARINYNKAKPPAALGIKIYLTNLDPSHPIKYELIFFSQTEFFKKRKEEKIFFYTVSSQETNQIYEHSFTNSQKIKLLQNIGYILDCFISGLILSKKISEGKNEHVSTINESRTNH